MTGKQRAKLRAVANGMDTIFQVGKSGLGDATIKQVEDALKARELIKLRVLETAPIDAREAATEIAKLTRSEIIQVIGTKFVLYRRNHENPVIEIS